MNNENSPQNSIDQQFEKGASFAKNKGSKAIKKGMRATGKLARKAGKKLGMAIGKAVLAAGKAAIVAVGPWLAVGLVIILLITITHFVLFENKGVKQEYSHTTETKATLDNNGNLKYNITKESQKIQRFYTYISGQSYGIKIGDKPKIYSPDENDIRDYFEREKTYRIDRDLLFALDYFMYDDVFRYPEQFIKPVYHNPETMELLPLTDDTGKLIAKSKKVNLETGEKLNEEELSVRDYGLGSLITFVDQDKLPQEDRFFVEERLAFKYTSVQIWNEEEERTEWIPYKESSEYKEPVNAQGHDYDEPAKSGIKEPIDLIESVVSMAGTVKYEYDANVTTGNPTRNMLRPFSACKTTSESNEECNLVEYSSYEKDVEVPAYDDDGKPLYNEDGSRQMTTEKRSYPLYMRREGGVSEVLPRIKTTEIKDSGTDYISDYLSYFEALVPQSVLDGEDIEERIPESSYIFDEIDTDSIQGLELGALKNSPNVMKAIEQGGKYFTKYAKDYGVDPNLLIAMAAQESSGDHYSNIDPGDCKVKGCGIMQIERPGIPRQGITKLSAYNHSTGNIDEMKVTYELMTDIEYNIKAGAMQLAGRLKEWDGNVLMALQAYNFGSKATGGGMGQLFAVAEHYTGKTMKEYIADPSDTTWMQFRDIIHNYPTESGINWSGKTYGDPLYIEHVLRYYPGDSLGEGIVLPPTGFLEGIIDGVSNFLGDLFKNPFNDEREPEPVTIYDKYETNDNIEMILNVAKTMVTKKPYSEIGESKTMNIFDEGFLTGISSEGITNEEFIAKFPQAANYRKPLDIPNPRITSPYGNRWGTLHKGTDIGLPIGTPLYAVADGTVYLARCATTPGKGCPTDANQTLNNNSGGRMVWINHDDGTQSRYLHMDKYAVKAGDRVVAGQQIGTSGDSGNGAAHLHFEFHTTHAPNNAPVDSGYFFRD